MATISCSPLFHKLCKLKLYFNYMNSIRIIFNLNLTLVLFIILLFLLIEYTHAFTLYLTRFKLSTSRKENEWNTAKTRDLGLINFDFSSCQYYILFCFSNRSVISIRSTELHLVCFYFYFNSGWILFYFYWVARTKKIVISNYSNSST